MPGSLHLEPTINKNTRHILHYRQTIVVGKKFETYSI